MVYVIGCLKQHLYGSRMEETISLKMVCVIFTVVGMRICAIGSGRENTVCNMIDLFYVEGNKMEYD